MKFAKYALFFLLFIINQKYLFSQDALLNKPFLKNVSELKETDSLNLIVDLNVFEYYKISQYDTELKRENFKRTNDYLIKYGELKNKKIEILKTIFFKKWNPMLPDYNIKKGGFDIPLYSESSLGSEDSMSSKTIKNIYFPSLPTKIITYRDNSTGIDFKWEVLPVKINKSIGTLIEEKRDEIIIYLIFQINGKKNVSFDYYYEGGWFKSSKEHLFSDKVRLIMVNDKTGEIYYDKEYKQ